MKMKKDLLTSAVNEAINTATQEAPQAAAPAEVLQTSETSSEVVSRETLQKSEISQKSETSKKAKAAQSGRGADESIQKASVAFSAINYDFIKTLSRARGETYTEFINLIVDEYRKQHQEQYEIALKLRASF